MTGCSPAASENAGTDTQGVQHQYNDSACDSHWHCLGYWLINVRLVRDTQDSLARQNERVMDTPLTLASVPLCTFETPDVFLLMPLITGTHQAIPDVCIPDVDLRAVLGRPQACMYESRDKL